MEKDIVSHVYILIQIQNIKVTEWRFSDDKVNATQGYNSPTKKLVWFSINNLATEQNFSNFSRLAEIVNKQRDNLSRPI